MKPKFLFPHRYKTIGWLLAIPCFILGLFCLYADFQSSFLEINLPFQYPLSDSINFTEISGKENNSYLLSGLKTVNTNFNFTDELATVGLIIGLIFIAFSKEKIEDEYVSEIRLESLQWAIYLNFGLLILATFFVHGGLYFSVIIYNMFTPLIIFIIRFSYILHIKPYFEAKNIEKEVKI
jgi:hypothetical protein